MAPYAEKNIVRGKAEKPIERWNRRWRDALNVRSTQEDLWSKAYNSVISKHETISEGMSNLYLSMSWPQKRAMESKLHMNICGERPYAPLKPLGQEDITAVKISEAFVQHFMSEDFFFEMLNCIQLVLMYGDAWMRFPWYVHDQEFEMPRPVMDEARNVIGFDRKNPFKATIRKEGIRYEARSPWRVVIDPAAYAPREGRMRWLIDTDARVADEDLWNMAEQGLLDKKAVEDFLDDDKYQDCGMINRDNRGEGRWDNKITDKKGLRFIRECYDFWTNEKYIIGGWDKILNGENGQKLDLIKGPPYQHFGLYNMPLEPYSKGLPWQLEYLETWRNHLINTAADEYAMAAYPPVIAPAGSDLHKDPFRRLRPDTILQGSPDAYGVLRRSTNYPESYQHIAFSEREAAMVTGVVAEGTSVTAAPGTTATSSSIAAAQLESFSRFVTMLLSHCVGKMALHNNMTAWQFSTETSVEKLPAELKPEFIKVRGMYGKDGVKPAFNVGYVPKDQNYVAARESQLNFMLAMTDRILPLTMAQVDPKTGFPIKPAEMSSKEWFTIMFKLAQVQNWERIFQIPPTENNPFSPDAFNAARGRGFASPSQPQPVPNGNRLGNMLGQMASRGNPMSNNMPNGDIESLLGIGR